MSKNRDFLDYLSLGNQLVQTSRLGDVRNAQSALAIFEAERLQSEQIKADAQAQEDKIREFVFGSSKLLHALESQSVQSKPLGALAVLYGLQRHIKGLEISTARVRSYEDKEKVHDFLEHVKRVVADCEGRLDAQGIEDAMTCAKYSAEASNLAAVIGYETKELELKERQKELTKLGPPGMEHFIPPLLSLPMLTIGIIMLAALSSPGNARQAPDGLIVIAAALILLGFGGFLPKGENQALLSKKALETEAQNLKFRSDYIADLRKQFGEGDLDHYRRLQAERTAFMERILEDGDDMVMKPKIGPS